MVLGPGAGLVLFLYECLEYIGTVPRVTQTGGECNGAVIA